MVAVPRKALRILCTPSRGRQHAPRSDAASGLFRPEVDRETRTISPRRRFPSAASHTSIRRDMVALGFPGDTRLDVAEGAAGTIVRFPVRLVFSALFH